MLRSDQTVKRGQARCRHPGRGGLTGDGQARTQLRRAARPGGAARHGRNRRRRAARRRWATSASASCLPSAAGALPRRAAAARRPVAHQPDAAHRQRARGAAGRAGPPGEPRRVEGAKQAMVDTEVALPVDRTTDGRGRRDHSARRRGPHRDARDPARQATAWCSRPRRAASAATTSPVAADDRRRPAGAGDADRHRQFDDEVDLAAYSFARRAGVAASSGRARRRPRRASFGCRSAGPRRRCVKRVVQHVGGAGNVESGYDDRARRAEFVPRAGFARQHERGVAFVDRRRPRTRRG